MIMTGSRLVIGPFVLGTMLGLDGYQSTGSSVPVVKVDFNPATQLLTPPRKSSFADKSNPATQI